MRALAPPGRSPAQVTTEPGVLDGLSFAIEAALLLARTTVLALAGLLLIGAPAARAQEEKPIPPPQSPGLIEEPSIMVKAIEFAGDRLEPGPGLPKDGFYPEFGYMITGSGWISAG